MKAAALFFAMLACLVGPVSPQGSNSGQDVRNVKVTVVCTDTDVRDVVKMLFAKVGANYEIAPEVQGTVTVDFQNVAFDEALRGVLDCVQSAYYRQDGVYNITKRSSATIHNTGGGDGFAVKRSPIKVQMVDADVREALRLLFQQSGSHCLINPAVHGKVTVDYVDVPFETALRGILDQVKATYRVEGGRYEIVPREIGDYPAQELPRFCPGTPTGVLEIQNKPLYLTPHRTVGGTFDLLTEAIDVAGYGEANLYSYGPDGFAIVLPVEAMDGPRLPRQGRRIVGWPNVGSFDFRQASKLLRREPKGGTQAIRVLVLLVTSDKITPEGFESGPRNLIPDVADHRMGSGSDAMLVRFAGSRDAFSEVERKRVWSREPKLRVLLYEVAFKDASGPAVLLKPGESKLSVKGHIIDAGLWSAKQLR